MTPEQQQQEEELPFSHDYGHDRCERDGCNDYRNRHMSGREECCSLKRVSNTRDAPCTCTRFLGRDDPRPAILRRRFEAQQREAALYWRERARKRAIARA